MLSETVRELFNKIMAKRHKFARCVAQALEQTTRTSAKDANAHFRTLMDKYRLFRETRSQAALVVQ